MAEKLRVVPLTLAEANELVRRWHRHHKPVVGHRFSIGVADTELHGAAIVGRPVGRAFDHHTTAEVTRCVTDGTPNASAELSRKVAEAMGWRECAIVEGFWMPPGEPDCAKGDHHCYAQQPPDLADARDRDAAIEWWLASVRNETEKIHGEVTTYASDFGATVSFEVRKDGKHVLAKEVDAPTVEEAFGRAFLAAMGVQG